MAAHKVKDSERKNGFASNQVEEYVLDSESDIQSDVISQDCAPGSQAYTADLAVLFIKSPSGNWVKNTI